MKVLFINTNCSVNKGSAAQTISAMELLRKLIPDSTFVLESANPKLDYQPCSEVGLKVVGPNIKDPFTKKAYLTEIVTLTNHLFKSSLWLGLTTIGLNANCLLNSQTLKEYLNADVIVDLSGDTLSDHGARSIFPLLHIFTGLLLKKKIVVYSQSIGPFNRIMLPLARFCLDNVDMIVVRERNTVSFLEKIRVNNSNMHLAAEVAYLLKPASTERISEIFRKENIAINNTPLIGLGTSELVSYSYAFKNETYPEFTARVADYLVEKFNAQVLLISHVIIPNQYKAKDDRYIARAVYQLAKNKDRIKVIEGDYSAMELKGIIGKCNLFIGIRMHSNIASTSMRVPTIGLGWSHKYNGIMKMLGQERYSCNIQTTTFEGLVSTIESAWERKAQIRKELDERLPAIEKSAFYSGQLIIKNLKRRQLQKMRGSK